MKLEEKKEEHFRIVKSKGDENCDNCGEHWADYKLVDLREYNEENLCTRCFIKLHPRTAIWHGIK